MTIPITPPPELVQQWDDESICQWRDAADNSSIAEHIATRAAQWGADQELEACCVELAEYCDCGVELTSGSVRELLMELRRPKPPSLAEEALETLENTWKGGHISNGAAQTIRRALERLQELQGRDG